MEKKANKIVLKTQKEIEIMVQGGRILARIMGELKKEVSPGIRTKDLEKKARELIKKYKAEPAFLGYDNYPAVLCTSVNDVIVHGVPSEYQLKEGDILSLDLGIKYKGYYADMAVTVPVGKVPPEVLRLIKVTKKALKRAIKKTRSGNTIGDIGNTIQRYVEKRGFSVIKELCGHGIGKELHEEPQILNYGKRKTGPKLIPGMVFCIEPMVSMGSERIKKSEDGFGYRTLDGSLSAHFEHIVAVTKYGRKVLTLI
ncbi:MAG: type I methionyl aminopeptidase [Candidatus Pacebacteria bacterium]|nr:type I methionyl aminopeptidase [Candidatus Paceibacterota bacterium]